MDDEIYRDRMQKGRSSIAWVVIISIGVLAGGLMQDIARGMIAKAAIEYELREWRKKQVQVQQERLRQRTEQERKQELARMQAEKEKRLNSDLCRFWMEQNRNSPSERTRSEVQKNC